MLFPNKGKVSGMIYSSRLLSELLFVLLSEKIVNPNHHQIDTVNMTYNMDLCYNLKIYTILCLLLYSTLGVFTHFTFIEDKDLNESGTISAEGTTSINDVDSYLNNTKEPEKKTKMNLIADELLSIKYFKIISMQCCLICNYFLYIILSRFILYYIE